MPKNARSFYRKGKVRTQKWSDSEGGTDRKYLDFVDSILGVKIPKNNRIYGISETFHDKLAVVLEKVSFGR